jgi:hypothetical protein
MAGMVEDDPTPTSAVMLRSNVTEELIRGLVPPRCTGVLRHPTNPTNAETDGATKWWLPRGDQARQRAGATRHRSIG